MQDWYLRCTSGGTMCLKKLGMGFYIAVAALAITLPAFPEATNEQGQGHAIVTVLPANDKNASVDILQRNLQVKVNGKAVSITNWKPLRGANSDLELVILIDGSASSSLGRQLDDISQFIQSLPANVKVAVSYMNAGRAVFTGPLSANHAEVARNLRIPGGVVGSNASPYFCLSDLARKWPSTDHSARREVVLITNGVDNYYQGFDPEDPYLKTAIHDSVRAGLVVYSIYTPNRGRRSNTKYQSFVGQSLLVEVTRATGGYSYWDGTNREPVSFRPYFDDIAWRLQNQYQLSFQSHLEGKPALRNMNLKVNNEEVEVFAPRRVFVMRSIAE
jgi:hypothetical protein